MTEKQIIDQTMKPNTASSLALQFKTLGIKEGDMLLVHSSMSNLGWVCGGAQSVIMALMGVLGSQGTLIMPTMTGDLSNPENWQNPPVPESWLSIIYESMPLFDPEMSPVYHMGRIPETFRKCKGVLRSLHPRTSFAAWGKDKDYLLDNHQLTPQFGQGSPLDKMYKKNARVLLLGTSYNSCTCFHLGEARWGKMPRSVEQVPWMENGSRYWKKFEDFAYDTEDFHLLGLDFERTGEVRKGIVGNAGCRLFSLQKAVDFAQDWMAKNR